MTSKKPAKCQEATDIAFVALVGAATGFVDCAMLQTGGATTVVSPLARLLEGEQNFRPSRSPSSWWFGFLSVSLPMLLPHVQL